MYILHPYFEAAVEDVRNDEFRPAGTYEFGLADGVDRHLKDYNHKEILASHLDEVEQCQGGDRGRGARGPIHPCEG